MPEPETTDIPEFLQLLNPEQRSAVMHGDAPLLIIAGAGSWKTIAGIATSRFHVNARDPELDDPSSDFSLVREVSHTSGAEFFTPDPFLVRINQWAKDGLPGVALKRHERMSLWDNWFVLLLLVVLMTSEWAIRKKRGLV